MKTTSKITTKPYCCAWCGHEQDIATNHWGEVYSRCGNWKCVSRLPPTNSFREPPRHICLEEPPPGFTKPEPWKQVKLGDIIKLRETA